MKKKEISLFSVGIFFPHSAEEFRGRKYSIFHKNSGKEKFYA